MQIGTKLGTDNLNIIDDATLANQLGYYQYDDEGVAVRRVNLMTNGVLTGRLHDRWTAGEMGEPVSGHAIAEDFRYAPIVRMGCIFIQPDKYSLEELLAAMDDGLYICNAMGGQTSGENFTFGANYGYIVKGGKLQNMIRDINIVGNLYKTLKNVAMISKDFILTRICGCGKGQTISLLPWRVPKFISKNSP
jgi:TldD protein